jgi:hypothetical protein
MKGLKGWAAFKAKARHGYAPLIDEPNASSADIEVGEDGGEQERKRVVLSSAELAQELLRVEDECEQLETRLALLRKVKGPDSHQVDERAELKLLQERRGELRELVDGIAGRNAAKSAEPGGAEEAKAVDADGGAESGGASAGESSGEGGGEGGDGGDSGDGVGGRRGPSAVATFLKSSLMKGIMRTISGVMAIVIYFADIISDIQVLMLLWHSGNYTYAWMSIFLLVAQVCSRLRPSAPASRFGTEASAAYAAYALHMQRVQRECLPNPLRVLAPSRSFLSSTCV